MNNTGDLISRAALMAEFQNSELFNVMPKHIELIKDAPAVPAVVLPHAVGDVVWLIKTKQAFKIQSIEIFQDDIVIYRCGNDGSDGYMSFAADEIGKRVLVGKAAEEALKALKAREGAEHDGN